MTVDRCQNLSTQRFYTEASNDGGGEYIEVFNDPTGDNDQMVEPFMDFCCNDPMPVGNFRYTGWISQSWNQVPV